MGQLRRKEKKLEELRARSATQEEMEAFEKTWLEQHLQARETLKEKREGQRVEKENEEGKWFESLERKNPSKGPKKGDESAKKFGNGEALTYTAKNGEKKRIPFAALVPSQGKWNGLSLEQKETKLESFKELKIGEKVNNTARGDGVTTCVEFLVNELTFEAGCLNVGDRHPDGDGKFKKSLDDVYNDGRISIYIDAFMDKVVPSDPLLSRTYSKKADVFAMFGVDEDAARAKWSEQSAKTTEYGKEYRKQEVKCEAVVCEVERGGGTRTGTLSTVKAKTVDGKPAHPQCVLAECEAVVCEVERGGGTRKGTLSTVDAKTVDGKPAHRRCVHRTCVICDKPGNYKQVCRVHPDGGGYCHNTLSCYGMHKFADLRGCGLCGVLVYETQKTPEEVVENVRRRGTEDGLKRGVENGSIEMPDRPVCDPCMDDVILEKAETLQKEIHVENFLALPTEVQKARVKALVTWLESLNFSSPADLSYESDNDCSESECY
jgi:hypothetical protein